MKKVNLTNSNAVALVDDEDFDRVSNHRWYLDKDGYARTNIHPDNWNMSEFIMGYIGGTIIDHEDRVPLNNQKYNLRRATKAQNTANSKLRCTNTTGYKGVMSSRTSTKFPYRAQIKVNGKCFHLGIFSTIHLAAKAYNEAAKKHFGEFAYQNKIEES